MSMNPYLAAMYNTHGYGQAVQEEQTKIASLELFAKTAAAEGIDLSQLTSEQQQSLYSQFISKLAEDDNGDEKKDEKKKDDDDDDKDEKKEEEKKEAAARQELAQVQEWQQKVAEADFLGRTMAHAFWNESGNIEKVAEEAGKPSLKDRLKGVGAAAAEKGKSAVHAADPRNVAAGLKAKFGKKDDGEKSASAFEQVAAEHAVKIAQQAGLNVDEVVEKVSAVLVLGGPNQEKTKVAQVVDNYEAAVNVRGLEYLEAAGYPVDWSKVLSS